MSSDPEKRDQAKEKGLTRRQLIGNTGRWFGLAASGAIVARLAGGCKDESPPQAATGRGKTAEKMKTPRTYRFLKAVDPGIDQLKSIARDERGWFYLAGQTGVVVFDGEWNRKMELQTSLPATGVAVAGDGTVFVSEQQKVHVFSRDGKRVASWGVAGKESQPFSYLTGLAVALPNVWVADAGNRVVHRFDATGDFIADLGGRNPETNERGLICPSPYLDCATAADGTLWVGNPGKWRIEHYDLNNALVGFWGRSGLADDCFSGCCNPTNLALTPDGNFVTAEKGRPRIKLLDPRGNLLAVMPDEGFSIQSTGMDLAADAAGHIYATDPVSNKVLIFVPA
jgi:DNA-binding beta-propeller fold protein YncE